MLSDFYFMLQLRNVAQGSESSLKIFSHFLSHEGRNESFFDPYLVCLKLIHKRVCRSCFVLFFEVGKSQCCIDIQKNPGVFVTSPVLE